MTENLLFLAGHTAYSRIKDGGLSPDDVKVAVGASGAAKWLVLHGLDSAIFAHWFKGRKKPLHLFGTSIGAWKFAAAAQADPEDAFDRLAHAYIHQYYEGRSTPDQVAAEARRIISEFLLETSIKEILSHPFYRFTFSAVRCRGLVATDSLLPLSIGLMGAYSANLVSRSRLNRYFERTLFYDPRDLPPYFDIQDLPLRQVPLSEENFTRALLASGSIPVIMKGVTDIPGAVKGTYRDGGILDYHPALPFLPDGDGIVLYPHFYTEVIPGWFEKKFPKRRADGAALDNALLLAPSPDFVSGLPYGRIPDRRDFNRMMGMDNERVAFWKTAVEKSRRLGDAFMEAVESGKIREKVRLIR